LISQILILPYGDLKPIYFATPNPLPITVKYRVPVTHQNIDPVEVTEMVAEL
jgi:hypothetical protein